MAKYSLFLSSLFLFFSCHSGVNNRIDQLKFADSLLISNPDEAYSILSGIDERELSHRNRLYYNLLKTIALDKTYFIFEDDSLIATTTKSGFRKDPYNNFRSNLYHGLVKLRISGYDSLGYYHLLKAEDICKEDNIPDDPYKRLLYWYMADYNMIYSNYDLAEKYSLKERVVSEKVGTIDNLLNNDISLFWIYSSIQDTGRMLEIIDRYQNDSLIPESCLPDIYNIRTFYHYTIKDYPGTIEHGKLEAILREKNHLRVKVYYTIASSYHSLGQVDSSIKYTHLALDNNLTTSQEENMQLAFYYNRKLGKLYSEKGDIINSGLHYEEALRLHDDLVKFHSNNSVESMEKILTAEKQARKLEQIESSRKLLYAIIIVIVLSSTIIFILIRNRILAHKRESAINEERRIEAEIKKMIVDVTIGQFDQLNNYMYDKVLKSQENILADELNDQAKYTKKENRSLFAKILEKEEVISYFPILPKLTEFSIYEKMIFLMIKLKLSTYYISKIFYSSENSIRGIKSRTRDKIKNSKTLTSEEKINLISLLESDSNNSTAAKFL